MRLAEDERARVPFALLGVVLLVGSVAVATIQFDRDQIERDAAVAGDRAEAHLQTVLRETTRSAGAGAAADPVVAPAETEFGELLDTGQPYRSYLELLIALGLRDRLRGDRQRVGDATAGVEFPAITNVSEAETAMAAVDVEARGPGLVDVTLHNASIVVQEGGQAVDRRTWTLSVTVTTPTLTLHDRTERFESRLDGRHLDSGSLSRGLTGGLYGLAWPRGYGQYGGLPIADVIANRHVELVANLAILDAQRSAFGDSDRAGELGLAEQTAKVGANETVGVEAGGLLDAALPDPNQKSPDIGDVTSPPTRTTEVHVNQTADRTLAELTKDLRSVGSGGDEPEIPDDSDMTPWEHPLEDVVRAGMAIEVGHAARREEGPIVVTDGSTSPGANWTKTGVVESAASVDDTTVTNGTAASPAEFGGAWDRDERSYEVTLEGTVPERYRHANGSERTREAGYLRTVSVSLVVADRPLDRWWIPEQHVDARPDPRYDAVVRDAADDMLPDGGWSERAATVAREGGDAETVRVTPDVPEGLVDDVYADLARLRDRVRPMNETTEMGALAVDANPAEELTTALEGRRDRLVTGASHSDALTERAMRSARSLYITRLRERLEARHAGLDGLQHGIDDKIDEVSRLPGAPMERLLSVGLDYARPDPAPLDTPAPAPELTLTVDGDPSYLTLEQINETATRRPGGPDAEYYPLGARTKQFGSLPTGQIGNDVADRLLDWLTDDLEDALPLEVNARVLAGSDGVSSANVTADFDSDRENLREAVNESSLRVQQVAITRVRDETAMDEAQAQRLVHRADSGWDTPSERARAYANGSATAAIEAALVSDGHDRAGADRIATLSQDDVVEALAHDPEIEIDADLAEPVADVVRERAEAVAADAVDDAAGRVAERVQQRLADRFGRAPVINLEGVPVLPIPGWWVATANLWRVEVHGAYASFAVRARQGGPTGGGQVSYLRDGSPVGVDVTGDGDPELLGHSDRITFEASTTVVVVVPPNGGGIGNTEAEDEQLSPGWARDTGPVSNGAGGGAGQESTDRQLNGGAVWDHEERNGDDEDEAPIDTRADERRWASEDEED